MFEHGRDAVDRFRVVMPPFVDQGVRTVGSEAVLPEEPLASEAVALRDGLQDALAFRDPVGHRRLLWIGGNGGDNEDARFVGHGVSRAQVRTERIVEIAEVGGCLNGQALALIDLQRWEMIGSAQRLDSGH